MGRLKVHTDWREEHVQWRVDHERHGMIQGMAVMAEIFSSAVDDDGWYPYVRKTGEWHAYHFTAEGKHEGYGSTLREAVENSMASPPTRPLMLDAAEKAS